MKNFNTTKFFDTVRKTAFKGRMSQAQVEGTEAILNSAERNNVLNTHHVAQILAQVYRETGGYMLPVKETVYPSSKEKNPSDATVIKRLNTAYAKGQLKGVKTPYWRDGAFGRGQIQLTHWESYDKFGKKLKIPLRENPSLALDKTIGADIAVVGMRDGMFRSTKLSDYKFPESLDAAQAKHPRRIVNGNDGSDKEVSALHRQFYEALTSAGWNTVSAQTKPVQVPTPKPIETKTDIYDSKYHPEILAVQEKLDSLGYPEVGEFDGRWGGRTRAAVLAFRADNGMKLTPEIDDEFLAALMIAPHRFVNDARKDATIKDLRAVGAEDVKQADQTQIGGIVLAGTGAVAVAGEVLDAVDTHSSALAKIAELIDPVKSLIQDNFWVLLIGAGAFFIWKSGILKRIRLEKHQTGKDVSE